MKRLLVLPLLLAVLLATGCVSGDATCVSDSGFPGDTARYELSVDGEHSNPSDSEFTQTASGSLERAAEVTLEVADEPGERREGLMGRESLPRDRGMAFVYAEEAPRSFWMKDTLIPLDIVFLDSELRVLNVETAEPRPNASDAELERYRSDGAARYVLEFNAGFAANHSIDAGDRIDLCEVEP